MPDPQTVQFKGETYTFDPSEAPGPFLGSLSAPDRAHLMAVRLTNGSVSIICLGRKFWTPEEAAEALASLGIHPTTTG